MRDVIREIQGWLEGEIRVVATGLRVGMRVYPALKRWAKFGRASGTVLSGVRRHEAMRRALVPNADGVTRD